MINSLPLNMTRIAAAYIRAGAISEALAAIKRALADKPDDPGVLDLMNEIAAASQLAAPQSRPLLSVIIPTCDRAAILPECLGHLELQDLAPGLFEVLVIDDASRDKTPEVLAGYAAPFSFRHFRLDRRSGPATARNVGLRAARGEIALFLNDDAMLEKTALRRHLETHLGLPLTNLSVLGRFDLPPEFSAKLWGYTLTHSDLIFDYNTLTPDTLYDWHYYYTCNISTPLPSLTEAGLFDEAFTGQLWGAEDIELGYRLAGLDPPGLVLFRDNCAAIHEHDLTVRDFARMFRVRGGGAVRMFLRHQDMGVHYRDIRAEDILFWRALPRAVEDRITGLHALLARTEQLVLSDDPPGQDAPALHEKDFPTLEHLTKNLYSQREKELVEDLDRRLAEVEACLAKATHLTMSQAARRIYPAALFLRWFHDTEGVCAAKEIERICRDWPLGPPVRLGEDEKAAPRTEQAGRGEDQDATVMFSVVSATYNAGPWLEDFFTSIIGQSLDFKKHIEIIIVDDGSTDNSGELALARQQAYPANITYIRKENGGQASARNLGMAKARGSWVTFIDPDDFVSENYFETVKNFIDHSDFDGLVIAANLIFYHDQDRTFSDTHPLNFKFREDIRLVDLMAEPQYIQLSGASAFFQGQALRASGLSFDPRVRPTGEDLHFINMFLLKQGNFKMAFLKQAGYFYRKRATNPGTVDRGWRQPAKYRDQLYYGYYDLLKQYAGRLGFVPEFVQNIVIYDLSWYFERMLGPGFPVPDFPVEDFLALLNRIFTYLEAKNIIFCKLPPVSLTVRLAMVSLGKGYDLTELPFTIEEISPDRSQLCLSHLSSSPADCRVYANGQVLEPLYTKSIDHSFMGRHVYCEQRFWFPMEPGRELSAQVNGQDVAILCRATAFEKITPEQILEAWYLPDQLMPPEVLKAATGTGTEDFEGCWLLMDRVAKADDNAEHLYRWLMRQPDCKDRIYFILDRKSADWNRLLKEGFRLLAYHSRQHIRALFKAAWLISSHVDPPVIDPVLTRDRFGQPRYKTAFLQHGIIKHDLSPWLNTIWLNMCVTSVRAEYEAMLTGRYKFTQRELALTGLARHDRLLRLSQETQPRRTIIFCPTWRIDLCKSGRTSFDDEARAFVASDFYQAWNALLASPDLARAAEEHKYRLIFLPHPDLIRFMHLFESSGAFQFVSYAELASVQDLLVSSAMLVSDYSSLVMDMAYINRPVAYFQFRENPPFFEAHMHKKGYFDYERDGFGPVIVEPEALIDHLALAMARSCPQEEQYATRCGQFFTLRDGRNCERIYQEILKRT